MAKAVIAQLYLTLDVAGADRLETLLDRAKPACVRLRIENASDTDVARECRDLCHAREIPLLVAGPDEAAVIVARAVRADGVHLEGAPKAAPWARRELGENIIAGINPGPERHEAMIAAETGADYVSLSPEWQSEDALPEAVTWWAAMIETPMVVENANTPERIRLLRKVAEFVVADADGAVVAAEVLAES